MPKTFTINTNRTYGGKIKWNGTTERRYRRSYEDWSIDEIKQNQGKDGTISGILLPCRALKQGFSMTKWLFLFWWQMDSLPNFPLCSPWAEVLGAAWKWWFSALYRNWGQSQTSDSHGAYSEPLPQFGDRRSYSILSQPKKTDLVKFLPDWCFDG